MNSGTGFLRLLAPVAPILQNISRRLLLKQTAENYETYLTHPQPMFHLNHLHPVKISENQSFSDVFWEHRKGALVHNELIKFLYSYYIKGFVIGLVHPYM